jgi:mannose-6-phosphate isomerase-like protein (cupin superfamily)
MIIPLPTPCLKNIFDINIYNKMEKKKTKRVFINPVYKDKATVLESVEETGGSYMLGELVVYPGGGNFMHTHSAFEETFTAVKGQLGIVLNNKKQYLQPGQSVTVPLHAPHHFFNDGKEPVICHLKFTPGHEGFVQGIAIGYGLAADGKTNSKGIPKSIMHLALLIVLTDTKPTGVMGMLFPVFKWLAAKAKKNGTEKALLDKYYYE